MLEKSKLLVLGEIAQNDQVIFTYWGFTDQSACAAVVILAAHWTDGCLISLHGVCSRRTGPTSQQARSAAADTSKCVCSHGRPTANRCKHHIIASNASRANFQQRHATVNISPAKRRHVSIAGARVPVLMVEFSATLSHFDSICAKVTAI